MTAATPHRISNERGDYYTTHQGYVEWLRYCAGLWRDRGDRVEQSRMDQLAHLNEQRGQERCPVCQFAAAGGRPQPNLGFGRRG
jgi:hypothetical protein